MESQPAQPVRALGGRSDAFPPAALHPLQERRSRLTLARRLLSKDSALTALAIAEELGALPPKARCTITHDNGGEFASHRDVADRIGLRAFFCDPHSPGNAAASRTPTACCAAICLGKPVLEITPTTTSTPSAGTSAQCPANASAIGPRSRHSQPTSVSHLKRESSTVYFTRFPLMSNTKH